MSVAEAPAPSAVQDTETAAELQPTLVELIALSLMAKQAHWNVTGPFFRPLHQHFDEIADAARGWADDVAERLEAIGVAADGRAPTVVTTSGLSPMPEGKLDGPTAVSLVTDRMAEIAHRVRHRVRQLDDSDLLSQDVLIEVARGLEKHLWMLREQLTRP
ncbi:MAG: DNA starvation/stationary phase protection protein [Chloroflexi bacterium]|nr:MAG: DNA starvation/stationary phase protection protein [Chloroflexota bacterium]